MDVGRDPRIARAEEEMEMEMEQVEKRGFILVRGAWTMSIPTLPI